jgi:hypothetical protein
MPLFFLPIKCRFSFFLSLHHLNNPFEKVYTFYFPLANSVAKKRIFLGIKNIGGRIFTPSHPSGYAYGVSFTF